MRSLLPNKTVGDCCDFEGDDGALAVVDDDFDGDSLIIFARSNSETLEGEVSHSINGNSGGEGMKSEEPLDRAGKR